MSESGVINGPAALELQRPLLHQQWTFAWPTAGQARFGISEISLAASPKSVVYRSPSCPQEGRLEIVTDAGQDAVDADAPLTNGADADGEVVWS
jgi:hypothetical protein